MLDAMFSLPYFSALACSTRLQASDLDCITGYEFILTWINIKQRSYRRLLPCGVHSWLTHTSFVLRLT